MSWLVLVIACLLNPISALSVANELDCYSCSSDLDTECISSPSTIIKCPITHGKGCSTKITSYGIIQRGCSDIGIRPGACQVSALFGTECVCHTNRCNVGLGIHKYYPTGEISCYNCSSLSDPGCNSDVSYDSWQIKCPINSGCYYMKRVQGGLVIHDRVCFQETSPATYYPPGCYTVFNELTKTNSEVCVCFRNGCNQNVHKATEYYTRESVNDMEQVPNQSICSYQKAFVYSRSYFIYILALFYFFVYIS